MTNSEVNFRDLVVEARHLIERTPEGGIQGYSGRVCIRRGGKVELVLLSSDGRVVHIFDVNMGEVKR